MSQGNSDVSWERLCAIGEQLGLLVPESVPYMENWAAKIRFRMETLERILSLVCDIHEAQLCGQIGLEAMRLQVMDMARKVVELPVQTSSLGDVTRDFEMIEREVHRSISFEADEVGRAAAALREAGHESMAAKLLQIRGLLEK